MEPWQLVALLGAFAAVAAFAAPKRRRTAEPAASGAVQLQTALEQFMENMEADNRDIAESIARLQQQNREDRASRDERIAALERRCAELEDKLARAELRLEERMNGLARSIAGEGQAFPARPAAEAASGPASAGGDRTPIRQRYPELFDLHAQGKSTDAIAKKVGMHKGEVMLILQLAAQEEERRV